MHEQDQENLAQSPSPHQDLAGDQLVDPLEGLPDATELSSPVNAVLQPGLLFPLYDSKDRRVLSPLTILKKKTSELAAVETLIILVAGIRTLWSPDFI